MRLVSVSLPVHDLTTAATFWSERLGLPVDHDRTSARVRIGTNVLELRPDPTGASGPHHLAVTIPTGSFATARDWLVQRAELLDRDGQDEFGGPAGWNSRSLYFDGPERSVLELIERRDLDPGRSWSGPFGPENLLGLSEVGIVVPDVLAVAARLGDQAGVLPYANPPAASFAAIGDVHGLLILVQPGRPWLPTTDRLAQPVETHVTASGGSQLDGAYALSEVADLTLAEPDNG